MDRSAIATVYRKELLEISRDRRTLIVMLVVPVVLYPLMALLGVQVAAFLKSRLDQESLAVGLAVESDELQTAFVAATEEKRLELEEVEASAAEEKVRNGTLRAAVIVPVKRDAPPELTLDVRILYDSGEVKSLEAKARVREIIESARDDEVRERLALVKLTEQVIRPFELHEEDLATASRRGAAVFGGFISFLLITMALSGAFYAALDLTAGERERGTLETLLVAPIGRHEVIIGKYLTVLTVAVIVSVVNIACMGLTFSNLFHGIAAANEIQFSVGPRVLLGILLTLLPLAALFSAVTVGTSTFARSYKEGQNYLTPLFMLTMFPAMLPLFRGIELDVALAAIPVAGPALLFHKLLLEEAALLPACIVFGSTVLYAALALAWATSLYHREEVLFREGDARPARFARPLRVQRVPTPAAAIGLFLLIFALYGYLALNAQPDDGPVVTLLLPQFLLFLAAPLAVAWWRRNDLRATFALRGIGVMAVLAVPFVTAGGFLLTIWIATHTQDWLGPPEVIKEVVNVIMMAAGPIGSILFVAVLPAVCEETLCRGYLLAGLRSTLRAPVAVAVSALLFGLLHVDLSRLLTTSVLGAVLAVVVLRGGSIWPAIAIHLLNNAIILGLSPDYHAVFPDAFAARWGASLSPLLEQIPPWTMPFAGIVSLLAGIYMLPRRNCTAGS